MKLSFYSDRQFREWYDYPDRELYIPQINVEKGIEILSVLEELENLPPQGTYTERTKLHKFTREVYKKACKKYPVTMDRAKFRYYTETER